MAAGTQEVIAPPPGFVPEVAGGIPPPPPTGFIPESEHLAGPTHTAARRNAMAQPGITPEARSAALEEKPVYDSPENPQLGNPTGTLPIGKEMQTASTLAGAIAGIGEGNMGMPSPAKIVPSGAWGKLGEYGRKIFGIEKPEAQGSSGGYTPPQAAPLNRQLPPAKEPIITPPPADRSGPIPLGERIDLGRGAYPEPTPPQAKPLTGSTSQQVDQLVNQAYGVKPLEKGVPLRSQIETKGYGKQYGTAGSKQVRIEEQAVQNRPEWTAQEVAYETNRLKGVLRNPSATAEERSIAENQLQNYQQRAQAPGATQDKPLASTPTATPKALETPPKAQPMSLAEKYPDKGIRQMVHANGEKVINAVGGDKETMAALHDLTATDLRQALINSGEDMGQNTITSSKFAGPGAITRQQAFERLLEKGVKPQEIPKLAKPPESAPLPKAEGQTEAASEPALKTKSAYSQYDIERGEAEMRGAIELGSYLPRAGRYFNEVGQTDEPITHLSRGDIKAGMRPGGTWTGITAQKPNIAGQFPWFDDPKITLSRVTRALHLQGGADWRYIMDKIAKSYEAAPF